MPSLNGSKTVRMLPGPRAPIARLPILKVFHPIPVSCLVSLVWGGLHAQGALVCEEKISDKKILLSADKGKRGIIYLESTSLFLGDTPPLFTSNF